jgi:hypothetical protein
MAAHPGDPGWTIDQGPPRSIDGSEPRQQATRFRITRSRSSDATKKLLAM